MLFHTSILKLLTIWTDFRITIVYLRYNSLSDATALIDPRLLPHFNGFTFLVSHDDEKYVQQQQLHEYLTGQLQSVHKSLTEVGFMGQINSLE